MQVGISGSNNVCVNLDGSSIHDEDFPSKIGELIEKPVSAGIRDDQVFITGLEDDTDVAFVRFGISANAEKTAYQNVGGR